MDEDELRTGLFGQGPSASSMKPDYIRFAALGDSATAGVGDRGAGDEQRGWARLLTGSMSAAHYVSACNLAVPGATISDVRRDQLIPAFRHRPHVASLVVGMNDVLRSDWSPERARADLLACSFVIARGGSLLLTPRFHDHCQILGLPEFVRRPLRRRLAELNEIYDEVHDRYGTLRLDLAETPLAEDRRYWALDRLHPSELGHRYLARLVAQMLNDEGLLFPVPSLELSGSPRRTSAERKELVTQGAPWLGRRIKDFAPWVMRQGLPLAWL